MEYKIVQEHDAASLSAAVMKEIANGWKPKGGVSVVQHHQEASPRYVQALAKLSFLSPISVQKILIAQHHKPGELDGQLGPQTLKALNNLRSKFKMRKVTEYEETSDTLLRLLK